MSPEINAQVRYSLGKLLANEANATKLVDLSEKESDSEI